MNVFIVYAHHDPNSFSKAMLDRALAVLAAQGHAVEVSDLHAMGFKAVADDRDFEPPRIGSGKGSGTDYQNRQRAAAPDGAYAADLAAEITKLERSDAVVFISPYYWFHFPAILKGWLDRVLVYDRFYSNDHATVGDYGRGGLHGRRSLIGLTFGAPHPPAGAGPSRHFERIEAIQSGVLNYVGLDAMRPFVAWGVAHVSDEQRTAYLAEWEDRIGGLFTEAPELRATDGQTPPPELLVGRARAPGDAVRPYGNDRAIAGQVLVVRLRPREGQTDALLAKLDPCVRAAVRERGTPVYSVLRAAQGEDVWLIEAFDDAAARDRHSGAAPFKTIIDEISGLLVEPPSITELAPVLSKGI